MKRHNEIIVFWVGALVVVLAVLYILRPILLPFVAGMAVAYALDPVAGWMGRRGVSRGAATAILLVVFIVVLAAIIVFLFPLLINQLIEFVERTPAYLERLQVLLASSLDSDWANFLGIDPESIRAAVAGFMARGTDFITTVIGSIWTGGRMLLDIASLFVLTPFIAFYLLRDWDKMVAKIDGLLPRDHAEDVRALARQMDHKVAAFVRGQLLVGTVLGIFYAACLMGIGLNYGLLVGLVAGLLSFIPFLGFTVGFAVSIVLAVVQFWPDWIWLLAVVAIFAAGEFLESYILVPRIVGQRVGLHPVWLIFALFAFGLLFGFVGLLLAVPLAAAMGVLLHFAIDRYRESPLYRGERSPAKR